MTWLILSVAIIIVIGAFCIFCGLDDNIGIVCVFGAIFVLVGILGGFELKDFSYIPAEPLAYNQTQTIFTTDEGTYLADGLYPDGTYLLTVDGKNVLVVWQAVDGEVG